MAAMVPVMAAVITCAGAVGAELPVGKQVPIQELRERASSLVGRDVVIAGVVETVEPVTEENFESWKLAAPCVGSYFVTMKDHSGSIDVLVRGNCINQLQARHGPRLEKGQTVWIKVRMFVPDLNIFALNPLVRAVAQDFGPLAPE
ncbi:exported protein of unknown function [Nitrospira moscoviensis]|uniref:Uncharacterized protein n=2 Tax=Nitrospira moscoviensis TaxID=42253 RepID=A0A0K2G9R2_NITMO|nr:exported protein of unknown function [Nitrospira moscoviensis]